MCVLPMVLQSMGVLLTWYEQSSSGVCHLPALKIVPVVLIHILSCTFYH
jgi:hypothetical protein